MNDKQLAFEHACWKFYNDFSMTGQQKGHFWKVEDGMIYYQLHGIGPWYVDDIGIQRVYRQYIANLITSG